MKLQLRNTLFFMVILIMPKNLHQSEHDYMTMYATLVISYEFLESSVFCRHLAISFFIFVHMFYFLHKGLLVWVKYYFGQIF